MNFNEFRASIQNQFEAMTKDAKTLFETDVDKDEMWNLYLDSFPSAANPIYRERREHDCSCCRHFVKSIGNAVTLKNGEITSIWDVRVDDPAYQQVADAMSAYVKSHTIVNCWHTVEIAVGTDFNYEMIDGVSHRWTHFYLPIPSKFVDRSRLSDGDYKGRFHSTRDVFKRSLDEITEDSVQTVLELIAQNSLYRGEEWKAPLQQFLVHKKAYDKLPSEAEKSLYAWENAKDAGPVVGRIRNHSIGVLLTDIAEEVDLDAAVRKYESIVAPANYKRPKAIFTQKMVEEAQKKIVEMGFADSLGRRFATLDDITVNNILYSNRDAAKRISGAMDVFADMKADAKKGTKNFDHVEEIGIADFVEKVLPTAQELEVWLENRHAGNMVSLIAPKNREAKSMFKWNNGFSWAYSGNVTDSMKERVKAAGGRVYGVLRFSIQWNDEDYNPNDFDAHCVEPNKNPIFFGNKVDFHTGGNLDVDIIRPAKGTPSVENITWPDLRRMMDGKYKFFVNCYSNRGGRSGFKAEIEFNGEIHSYEYPYEIRQGEDVQVAEVTLKNGVFTIVNELPSITSSKEIWGVQSNNFVPVSVVMYSPNYWYGQHGVGNRHYFFMLKDCANPEQPNGFYNEFLNQELMEHKRVLEALGAKLRVEDVQDQLSGLGFSSTQRNELIVRVTGASKRVLKIKF